MSLEYLVSQIPKMQLITARVISKTFRRQFEETPINQMWDTYNFNNDHSNFSELKVIKYVKSMNAYMYI